jgi:predicted transcriptional regulator YdeE
MEILPTFKLIGISIRSSNISGQAAQDLGLLWQRFFQENISDKIPNKTGEEIYSVYTDYESDYQGEYTCLIGMKTDSLNEIPVGLIGREFSEAEYKKFVATGKIPEAVVETWMEIWSKDKELNRSYTADFEIYGPASQQGDNSEVEIFIAVNS